MEQRLGLLQVEGAEAFCHPAIDRSEEIAGLIALALIAPEPRHAHGCAQFPGLRLLLTGNRERALEIGFRRRRIRLGYKQRDFPGYSMEIGLTPAFLGCFRPCNRFAYAAPRIIEL